MMLERVLMFVARFIARFVLYHREIRRWKLVRFANEYNLREEYEYYDGPDEFWVWARKYKLKQTALIIFLIVVFLFALCVIDDGPI